MQPQSTSRSTDTTTVQIGEGEGDAGRQPHEYQCGLCDAVYPHEILTRVHITRSDDDDHANYDGFMPEATVEVVDGNGSGDEVSRRPHDIDVEELGVEDLPDDFSTEEEEVLLAAAHNPYVENHSELYRQVNDTLRQRAECDELSYPKVHTLITEYFTANGDGDGSEEFVEEFDELTPTQQAIVIARLLYPDKSKRKLAPLVGESGVSESYPNKVLTKAAPVVDHLESLVGDSLGTAHDADDIPFDERVERVKSVIEDEAATETVEALEESNLLASLELSFSVGGENTGGGDVDSERDGEAGAASSVGTRTGIMSASPSLVGGDRGESADGESGKTPRETRFEDLGCQVMTRDSSRRGGSDGPAEMEQIPEGERIPIGRVKELRERIAFLNQVLEHHPDDTVQTVTAAVLDEVDTVIEDVLAS